MKAIILGGVGTSKKSIIRTINIYKNEGIKPFFFEAEGIFGNNLFRPKLYKKKSIDIVKNLKKDESYILHCFSGSNWLGYTINSKMPANSIILESSPARPSVSSFQNYIKVDYGINFNKSIIQSGMNILQIPIDTSLEFYDWYSRNKPTQNTSILIGEKDKIIDLDYIKSEYISNKSNNKLITFSNSGHCNISKRDSELYRKVLKNVILDTKIRSS